MCVQKNTSQVDHPCSKNNNHPIYKYQPNHLAQ